MSEAEAGPRRIEDEEELTSRNNMDSAPAKRIKDDRRSSSTDVGDDITLQTICYKGTTLKIPGDQEHMYHVAYRILKNVYQPLVEPLLVGLPHGWEKADKPPPNAEIASYCKKYNMAAKPYAKNWGGSFNTETLKEWGQPQCTYRVAAEITSFAYECAVPRPNDLNNHYKSFSSETYGETNLEQMASIIEELNIGPQDVFVDLGSGIGQLVCFTAALARTKKAVGIELSPTPAGRAEDMSLYFKKIMSHFGKHCGKYELIEGNFLDAKFKKLICEEATVIFINNYAFGPDLMFKITNSLLQDLKHGTRIITTKAFGSNKREITYRSTSDINSMSHTTELRTVESAVSWTANKVSFWLTTMDHTKLIKYYEDEQRKKQDAKNLSREGSEMLDREPSSKKRKAEVNGRDKIKTEQAAASHQSPKWNEPDTEYTPPLKKAKKHRERENHEPKHHSSDTPSTSKKKKIPKEKTPKEKPPKSSHSSSHHHKDRHSSPKHSSKHHSATHHTTPSLAKATAPPPPFEEQKPKIEVLDETDKLYGQFDAKTMKALDTIREAASTSTQAAAIQDAIETVLSHPEGSPSQSGAAPPSFGINPTLPAPVAVYPPSQIIAAPPPPPNAIPPTSEVVAEQRHTFMIPPTDPYYNMVVSTYFEFKNHVNQARIADPILMCQLRHDIENEKSRQHELQEAITSTNSQIDNYLAKGVTFLKNRLDELGMTRVNDVTELLSGSKQIVTQHKTLTTEVAHMEASVLEQEQKLRLAGYHDAIAKYDEAARQNINIDFLRVFEGIVNSRHLSAHSDETPASESKVSPNRRSRNTKQPRQTNSTGKRGPSSSRKAEASEEVEMEIRDFVQRALQVDNAVKEKERKARGNFSTAATERVGRKGEK